MGTLLSSLSVPAGRLPALVRLVRFRGERPGLGSAETWRLCPFLLQCRQTWGN